MASSVEDSQNQYLFSLHEIIRAVEFEPVYRLAAHISESNPIVQSVAAERSDSAIYFVQEIFA
jgi:hypothetical protein